MVSERERLVELLNDSQNHCATIEFCDGCIGMGKGFSCFYHYQADYLLANGVIVPPCKVGDTVYSIEGKTVKSHIIEGIQVWRDGEITVKYGWRNQAYEVKSARAFGKTVFLTREEAEAALAERSKG